MPATAAVQPSGEHSRASGPTRRAFLRRAGGLAAVTVAGTRLAARPGRAEHAASAPTDVTLDYPESWLERYRPRLDLSAVEANDEDTKPTALYAWRATSPDYGTAVGVYWAEYEYQQGILPGGADSHFGDHEPIYVVVDRASGDVAEVVYSAYHWLRGRTTTPPLYDGTHVEATVVSPWHQYSVGSLAGGGEFVPVEQLGTGPALRDASATTEFESWLDDDEFHDALAVQASTEPWLMTGATGRGSWWANAEESVSVNEVFVSTMLVLSRTMPFVDFGGASESDQLE